MIAAMAFPANRPSSVKGGLVDRKDEHEEQQAILSSTFFIPSQFRFR